MIDDILSYSDYIYGTTNMLLVLPHGYYRIQYRLPPGIQYDAVNNISFATAYEGRRSSLYDAGGLPAAGRGR